VVTGRTCCAWYPWFMRCWYVVSAWFRRYTCTTPISNFPLL